MTNLIACYNGQFKPESEIAISPNDRGFLYGDGVFETLRAINSRIIAFGAHMRRMYDAAASISLPIPVAPAEIREVCSELLKRNRLTEAGIRISLSRGESTQFGYGYSKGIKPTLLMQIRPAKKAPEILYEKGVRAEFQTTSIFALKQPQIKSLSALANVTAKQSALDQNVYESILTDTFDLVYEATSSNVFIVKGTTLITPPLESGILPGVTRARVIHLAKKNLKIPVSEKQFSKKEFLESDEVFLTNTNIDVLPVTQIGGKIFSDGKIGEVTKHILNAYRQTLIEILE